MTARRPKILLLSFAFVLQVVCAGAQAVPAPPPAPVPVPAPALAITGNRTVAEYQECVLTLTGGTASCAWLVMPEASEWSSGQTIVFTGPPGNYTVVCMAVSAGQPVIMKVAVTIGKPAPGPTPGPTPPPAPPANPPYMAIAIYDTTNQQALSAGQLAVWVDPLLNQSMLAIHVHMKRLDVNNPSIATANWKKALAGVALPALVVIDKTGLLLSSGPLVDSPSMFALVKKLGAA